MYSNLKLILISFTRQESANDCGAACLRTIFNYSGLKPPMPNAGNDEPLSISRLQELGVAAGLSARGVRMDADHLRKMESPCILHVMSDAMTPHFIVSFGYDTAVGLYLIADPDGQVNYVTETELLARWQSRAALYFENLTPKKNWRARFYPWNYLFRFDFVPGIIWFAVPLLNVFGSLLGLGATLVVEKAITPQFLNAQSGFIALVFVLLACLSLAKCAVGFVKERLVINFASRLDASLYLELIAPSERLMQVNGLLLKRFSETIRDVQRIHQSVSMLVGGVLSDGLMLVIILVCIYLYFPVLVVLEIFVVAGLVTLTDRQLPFMLVNFCSTLAPAFPANLMATSHGAERESIIAGGIEANAAFSRKSFRVSVTANKLSLYFDAIASLNLIIVLAYTISRLRTSAASYPEFIFGVILCFAFVNIATKICNSLFLVAQGAERLGRRPRMTKAIQ
ncbi:cysteine peptidase family C39 domain-containing protein [Mucilaginibacter sp.]|jgi:predicted double-glycine peptidase|uniref:cysteine peptidase family C39 domain-containing protein n=1 Tax=Mucilaginibacter sp. TaxID=1882438 RepID=UPI002B5C3407|nr:cysteine peptidase family C39 domain-containing protein [Mucilaginibacter sp.]HTI58998.1 cysteine peptidase family C39 domain-containing protein [Mucilaginibacter sp.]